MSNEWSDSREAIEGAAREVGIRLTSDFHTFERTSDLELYTAPIQTNDIPTPDELIAGVDLLLMRAVSHYRGWGTETLVVNVSIPDPEFRGPKGRLLLKTLGGDRVRDLEVEVGRLDERAATVVPSFDDLLLGDRATYGKICGVKKCFVWKRQGFLKWKFGCINKHTGAVVPCVG